MDCKAKKYLHIYDWNYWWGYYRCCKDWEPFHAAEFSLSEDEAGKAPFFHFDFHNLPALHQTILDGEFVEPDNPDHPHFLEQARRLRSGEQDWFVGALYYPLFSPEMHFCNASVRSGVPLTQLLSPSVPPYYGVIFLREERPPHSGGADALGGDSVPAPVRPAVFLHACTSSQPAGGDGAV